MLTTAAPIATARRDRDALARRLISASKPAIFAAALSGCVVDAHGARQVLERDGYTEISVPHGSGLAAFMAGCDRRYPFQTPFEATLQGERVAGVVCSGASERAPQIRRSK